MLISKIKKILKSIIFKYDSSDLHKSLIKIGVRPGDVLMVHSSWVSDNGFSGTAKDFIDTLKSVVGNSGMLSMMSMPYHNESTASYLAKGQIFNVKRSPSKVGLLSEVFRRGKQVRRSLNAAHPVLAWGEGSEKFINGHEITNCSFGDGTPFERLCCLNAKILLVDTPFNTITFNHYLEFLYRDSYCVNLLQENPISGVMLNYDGDSVSFSTKVISPESAKYRIDSELEKIMQSRGFIKKLRIGNTRLMLVEVNDLVSCAALCVNFK